MAKKIKTETDTPIMPCCENCRHWNVSVPNSDFGLCRRIRVGTDVRISGKVLMTSKTFACYLNVPKEVVISKMETVTETEQTEQNNDDTD